MASKYWLKLYYETIHDWKFMSLPDESRLLFYDFLCIAGEHDKNGLLPPMDGLCFILRKSPVDIERAALPLVHAGILEQTDNDTFFIVKFANRQGPTPGNERVENFRKSQKRQEYNDVTYGDNECNEVVTKHYTDVDIELDNDVDVEKDVDVDNDDIFLYI